MSYLAIQKMESFSGAMIAPPSKYHTHRAFILSSLAEGESAITGTSESLDNMSTVRCLTKLGTRLTKTPDGYIVRGGAYQTPDDVLDVGNSGSTIQFLMGLAATVPGAVVFTGDASIRSRPQKKYLDALNRWGIEAFSTRGDGHPPIVVKHRDPRTLPAQVKVDGLISPWTTGLILLAPFTGHDVTVRVTGAIQESSYVAMTIDMLKRLNIRVDAAPDRATYFVPGGQTYRPAPIHIPGDIALASFGLALAALSGSRLRYENIDLSIVHPEAAIVPALQRMGADVRIDEKARAIEIVGGKRLQGIEIDCGDAPDMVPILSVLLALAKGTSRIHNAAQLRYKECDRLAAMMQLNQMGARVTEIADGLEFEGVERLRGATIDSFKDHRVQMSFAVAGCIAEGVTYVSDAQAAGVSYPGFLRDVKNLGAKIEVEERV
ncbi:MAG: 3-phosphoshikimate 1-carboxyvinyltransferase [Chloroflexi bacterium]|nr:3-phosphoshikimate 1-carboxyvinyltransferase [Chloroflexota bacterium]